MATTEFGELSINNHQLSYLHKLFIVICLIGALQIGEAISLIFSLPFPAPGFYFPYAAPFFLPALLFVVQKIRENRIQYNRSVLVCFLLIPACIFLLEVINTIRLGQIIKFDIFFQYVWLFIFIVVLGFLASGAHARSYVVKVFFYLVTLKSLLYLVSNELTLEPTGAYLFAGFPLYDLKPWVLNGKLQYEAVAALLIYTCFFGIDKHYFRNKQRLFIDLSCISVMLAANYIINSLFSYLLILFLLLACVLLCGFKYHKYNILIIFISICFYSIVADNKNSGELLDSVDAFSTVTSDIYYKHERYQSENEMEGENQFGSVYSRLRSNWNSILGIIDTPFFGKGYGTTYKESKFLALNSHTHYLILLDAYGLLIAIPILLLMVVLFSKDKFSTKIGNRQKLIVLMLLIGVLTVVPDLLLWFSVLIVLTSSHVLFIKNPVYFRSIGMALSVRKILNIVRYNRYIFLNSILATVFVVGFLTFIKKPEYGAIVSLKPIYGEKGNAELEKKWIYEVRRGIRETENNQYEILSTSNRRILLEVNEADFEKLNENLIKLVHIAQLRFAEKLAGESLTSIWMSRININFRDKPESIQKLRPNIMRNVIISIIFGVFSGFCFVLFKASAKFN